MNNSTDNVTLYAVFVNEILKLYQDKKEPLYESFFRIVQGYDLSVSLNKVPMQLYNDMCQWLEQELGPANLKKAGMQIAETVYQTLLNTGRLPASPQPIDLVNGLVYTAATMIQDPEGRGWVVLEANPNSILVRRTQTFNSILQLGLLRGLVQKARVRMVEVNYAKSVMRGDEHDEYLISWA